MTDVQFGALVTVITAGLAAIAAAIRFTGARIVKALDDNSKAMLENTASNAVLATKIDAMHGVIVRERTTPPIGIPVITGGKRDA